MVDGVCDDCHLPEGEEPDAQPGRIERSGEDSGSDYFVVCHACFSERLMSEPRACCGEDAMQAWRLDAGEADEIRAGGAFNPETHDEVDEDGAVWCEACGEFTAPGEEGCGRCGDPV